MFASPFPAKPVAVLVVVRIAKSPIVFARLFHRKLLMANDPNRFTKLRFVVLKGLVGQKLLHLAAQPLNQQVGDATVEFGLLRGKCIPFFFGKMPNNNASQHVAEAEIAADAVGDEFKLFCRGKLKKATFALLEVIPENLEQQFVLQLQNGPQGCVLKMLDACFPIFT